MKDFNRQSKANTNGGKGRTQKSDAHLLHSEMFRAIASSDRTRLKNMLDAGAQMDVRDVNGRTPLEAAVEHQAHACIHLLLVRGAEPNVLGAANGLSPLHKAAWGGKDGIVRMLLLHGADINLRARDGSTALHFAVAANQYDVVKLLLDRHAKTGIADNMGEVPLTYAEGAGLDDIAQLLREHASTAHAKRIKALRQSGAKP